MAATQETHNVHRCLLRLKLKCRMKVGTISLFGEVVPLSGLYEFHICTLCREVARRELFAKIPSLPFALFLSLLNIHDH